MIYERITRDGRRELRIDDEIYEVPLEEEIAPDALFPDACRRAYLADPLYMSVSPSDMSFADVEVLKAAEWDLRAMRDRLPLECRELIDPLIEMMKAHATVRTTASAIESIERDLEERRAWRPKPSAGPQYEDEVWYRGTDMMLDQEINRRFDNNWDEEEWVTNWS